MLDPGKAIVTLHVPATLNTFQYLCSRVRRRLIGSDLLVGQQLLSLWLDAGYGGLAYVRGLLRLRPKRVLR